jgi:MFS family permease
LLIPCDQAAGGIGGHLAPLGVNRGVAAISLSRIAELSGTGIFLVVLPLYVYEMPEIRTRAQAAVVAGVLVSAFGFISSIAQPLTGILTDRLGRRKLLVQWGLLVTAASTLAFLRADGTYLMLALRMIQGLGVALTVPASMALIVAYTLPATRGGAMGFYSTMRMVGLTIGPLIGGLLFVRFGFQVSLVAASLSALAGWALVTVMVTDRQETVPLTGLRPFRLLDRRLLSGGILYLALATMLMAAAFSMITALEGEINSRLQQTALGFGAAYSALTVARLLLQLPIGQLSDRIGRKSIIVAGLLLLGPSTALLGQVRTTMDMVLLRALQGVAAAAVIAPAQALAADLSVAGGEGQQMSLLGSGYSMGTALGPLAAGILGAFHFDLPFLLMGVVSILAALLVVRNVRNAPVRR